MYSGVGLPPGAVLDPAATLGWRMARPGEIVPQSAQPAYQTSLAVAYNPAQAKAQQLANSWGTPMVQAKPNGGGTPPPPPPPTPMLPVQPPPTITPPPPTVPPLTIEPPVISVAIPVANPISQGTTPTPASYPSSPTQPAAPAAGAAVSPGAAQAVVSQPVILPGAAGPSGDAVTPAVTTAGVAVGATSPLMILAVLAVLAFSVMQTHGTRRR